MNPETTYVVMRSDWSRHEYKWRELVWLWRTAQLPQDAVFREGAGEWRPIAELVEVITEEEKRSPPMGNHECQNPSAAGSHQRSKRRWFYAAFWIFILVMTLLSASALRDLYLARQSKQQAEREARDLERADRMEHLVKGGMVVPGMIPQQVRRSLGEPRMINATADASRQKWVYRHQTVIFEHGIVTRIDPAENR